MLSTLENLFKLARERKEKPVDGSYTNKLLSDKSLSKSKVLEEINELIEAVDKDTNKIHEAADVFYHLIIYLEAHNIKIEDIESELEKEKKSLMSKIKYIVILLICYGLYKGYVAFTNFEIGVSDRVTKLEEAADFERQGEVIALMMYLGDPPELNEHLLVKNKSKCLEMKQIAEETSFAYYECAIVDANLKGGKIISINEELKVLQ